MDERFTYSEQEIEQLAQEIKAKAAAPRDVNFCGIWPSAKQALEVLRTILDVVPGAGLFAKAAIGIVIGAGDAAYKAFCS